MSPSQAVFVAIPLILAAVWVAWPIGEYLVARAADGLGRQRAARRDDRAGAVTARRLDYSDRAFTWCTGCCKKTWPSRRAARRAAKRHHPGDLLNAYPCPHRHAGWHYGHLQPGDRDQRRTA